LLNAEVVQIYNIGQVLDEFFSIIFQKCENKFCEFDIDYNRDRYRGTKGIAED